MKLSHLATAAVLAVGSVTGAHAGSLGTLDLSSGSNFFGNTPTTVGFADWITFNLTTASTFNGSVVSVANGNQDIDFNFVFLTGPSGLFQFTQSGTDALEIWSSPAAGWTLSPGTYQITLAGTNTAGIASYAANVAVTAVPEPGSLALILAGGGVLGFLARRRRV